MPIREESARRVAAALDAVAIVVAATAVVSLLGAAPSVRLDGIRVTVAGGLRPALVAAGLMMLRWWLFRVPLFGSERARHPVLDRSDARELSERPLIPPNFLAVALLLTAAAILPMRAQLVHLHSVPDLEDPLFSAWRVGWFAHQIVTNPLHLFDANIFYPTPLTLTYSDSHLLLSALAAPLIWLGVDALPATNLLFVAAFPLAALAYCLAAWRITGDVRAAAIAGLLAAWSPFHFEHISHLELQWFCWVPLALVALQETLTHGGWVRGAALGAAVAAQALSSMYFGLMLAAYLVPFGLCLIGGWRIQPPARLARAALAAAPLLLLSMLILGPPYLGSRAARGDRTLASVAQFSAAGRDYAIPNIHSATWGHRLGSDRKMERALFPGVMTIGLAVIGLAPPLTVMRVALIVSGALAFDWSLGVNGLMFDELRGLLLPVRGLRAPARFVVFVVTSLILLAAAGAARLLTRLPSGRVRNVAFAALVALTWIDLRPTFRLMPAWRHAPPIYAAVRPPMVLAEFPMRFDWNISYMYFSTTHWARLVNGYSGYLPPVFGRLQDALGVFPAPAALALVREQGATHITINCRFYGGDEPCAPVLAALDRDGSVRLTTRARWEGSEVRLYELITQKSELRTTNQQSATQSR